jgi:hypothetical protein
MMTTGRAPPTQHSPSNAFPGLGSKLPIVFNGFHQYNKHYISLELSSVSIEDLVVIAGVVKPLFRKQICDYGAHPLISGILMVALVPIERDVVGGQ